MFGPSPAEALKIADETVACAVNVAAAMVLSQHDQKLAAINAKNAAMEAMAAMWGGSKEPQVTWERERELD